MGRRKCCVTDCPSSCSNPKKVSYFSFPKEKKRLKKWKNSIPKSKTPLDAERSFVCELHFEPRFIKKNSASLQRETGLSSPAIRTKLTSDAVPTLFSSVSPFVSIRLPKTITSGAQNPTMTQLTGSITPRTNNGNNKTKANNKALSNNTTRKTSGKVSLASNKNTQISGNHSESVIDLTLDDVEGYADANVSKEKLTFTYLKKHISDISVPNEKWIAYVSSQPNRIYITEVEIIKSGVLRFKKQISISPRLQWKVYVKEQPVTVMEVSVDENNKYVKNDNIITNLEDLKELVGCVNKIP